MVYKCDRCGKYSNYLSTVEEYRGECFGFPSYETVAYTPCCEYWSWSEFEEDEVPEDVDVLEIDPEQARFESEYEAYLMRFR